MTKYNFSNLIDNNHIKEFASRRLRQMPHAIIISGAQGTGKSLVAMCLAKVLSCKAPNGIEACTNNPCSSCASLEAGTHPDIHIFKKENTTKKEGSINTETARSIVTESSTKPFSNTYKVFIIESADQMPIQAQNALLKKLEEPPSYAVFILTATTSLLPTIHSRCIRLSTTEATKKALLQALGPHNEVSSLLPHAHGSIGRAQSISQDQDFIRLHAYVQEITSMLPSLTTTQLLSYTKTLEPLKHRISDFLAIAQTHYTTIASAEPSYKARQDIISKLDAISIAQERLLANGNFQIVIDSLLLSLHQPPKDRTISTW